VRYRRLGKSEFEVSVLSFGAWQIGDPDYWGTDAESDATKAVHAALDLGVTLFDTAESYGDGESERVLGRALGSRRSNVIIASKVSPEHGRTEQLRAACEGSLERLNTDYIDLYQIHWPFRDASWEEAAATLDALKQEGKIRAVALSNFGPHDLDTWMRMGSAVSNQIGYNIAFRAPEYQLFPACRKYGLGVLAYMPLLQGILTGRWKAIEDIPMLRRRTRHFARTREGTRHGEKGCEELLMGLVTRLARYAEAVGQPMAALCLGWLLAQPGVSSAIIGARNPAQVMRNALAADLELGPAIIAIFNEMSAPLKTHLGTNPDLWQSGDRARIR
jgi:myo-inositol catabolism protein IolS